jgi:hypothetical protein
MTSRRLWRVVDLIGTRSDGGNDLKHGSGSWCSRLGARRLIETGGWKRLVDETNKNGHAAACQNSFRKS